MKIILENHGKVYKVFRVDPSKYDGKNRTLLGKFKNANDAVRFMNDEHTMSAALDEIVAMSMDDYLSLPTYKG